MIQLHLSCRKSVAAVLVTAMLAWGCSSDGKAVKESTKTTQGLTETRKALEGAKEQVNETMAAMNALSGGGDLRSNYAKFAKERAELQSDAERAGSRARSMRERANDYIARWQKEAGDVSDPQLRAGVEQRRQKIKDNFDRISQAARNTKEAYDPLMKNLTDIEKALGVDLTPQGVQVARPAMDRANSDAGLLNQRIDELIAELDKVSAGISPTGSTR